MRYFIYEDPTGNKTILSPIIMAKFPVTRKVSVPICESCMLSRSKKISTGATKVQPLPKKEGT